MTAPVLLGDGYDQPHDISDLDIAFGANALEFMPPMSAIPDEFCDWNGGTPEAREWVDFQSTWFARGLPGLVLAPRDGIDRDAAVRHLRAIQGSFAPKHEHKMAAVAWLASRWFVAWDAETKRKQP